MKIGICITAYKRREFVDHALASAALQTHKPQAIVVVLDSMHSFPQHTLSLLEERGIPFTQLVGSDYAQFGKMLKAGFMWLTDHGCEVVSFLDDDDELSFYKLRVVNRVFEWHPDVALVFDPMIRMNRTGKLLPLDEHKRLIDGYLPPSLSAFVRCDYGETLSRMCVRVSAFADLEWLSIGLAPDTWMAWHALRHGSAYSCSLPMTRYRAYPESTSATGSDGGHRAFLAEVRKMLALPNTAASRRLANWRRAELAVRCEPSLSTVTFRCWASATTLTAWHLREAARDTARAVLGHLRRTS